MVETALNPGAFIPIFILFQEYRLVKLLQTHEIQLLLFLGILFMTSSLTIQTRIRNAVGWREV